MDVFRSCQLSLMLMLAGICLCVAFTSLLLNFKDRRVKISLFALEMSCFVLLMSDRYFYIYEGNITSLGFVVFRLSCLLFNLSILAELMAYNVYIKSILTTARKYTRLDLSGFLLMLGMLLLVVSQFTGLYYTIDATNHYNRSPGFILSFLIPMIVLMLQFSTVISYYRSSGKRILISLILFPAFVSISCIMGPLLPGLSLNTFCCSIMAILLFASSIIDLNRNIDEMQVMEREYLTGQASKSHELFSQTVEALAGAIDAKDKYTHGHSTRVAEYAMEIARMDGRSAEECEEIYFAGMLHDVGKIGIPDSIITKDGKLTPEEFAAIKKHPVTGYEILSKITKQPYIMTGARYHHERYDGKGYPEGLKGTDIPELARIIAVADAYDAMTSKRSYRDPIPQQKVREEILKGLGTQFDPLFGKYMLRLIDTDYLYQLKEGFQVGTLEVEKEMVCGEYMDAVSNGMLITDNFTTVSFSCTPDKENGSDIPAIVLFDSLEGRVYRNEMDRKTIEYYEFGLIYMNGSVEMGGIRNYRMKSLPAEDVPASVIPEPALDEDSRKKNFFVEAVRYEDHMLIRIHCQNSHFEFILALPDSTRFTYMAVTGERCRLQDISLDKSSDKVPAGYIPRIAEKVSYITGPSGDMPNVQIDGWRTGHSMNIPLMEGVKVDFHYMTLPFASRIWHCPSIVLYSSDDREVYGKNYREYAVIRLNGESWGLEPNVGNSIVMNKDEGFTDWDVWMEKNKAGEACTVTAEERYGTVIIRINANGLEIVNETYLDMVSENLCIVLTGDECALTGIRVSSL